MAIQNGDIEDVGYPVYAPLQFTLPSQNATLAVTASSSSVALPGSGSVMMIKNVGSSEAFIAAGNSAVVAVAGGAATSGADGSFSISAGQFLVLSLPLGATTLAAICAGTNTTTLRISLGHGT